MYHSLLVSVNLGLSVAVLATLQIMDWRKKRHASRLRFTSGKQKIGFSELPTGQRLAPIISQAELIAEAEMQIAEELRQHEANHRG